jgi:FkbM family methyltransferase
LKIDDRTGLHYRPDTSDVATLREYEKIKRYFKWFKDKVIMDCGSNIGVWTFYALANYAKKVIAYEVETVNCTIFKKQNFRDTKLIQAAITDDNKDVYLTIKNTNGHTICGKDGFKINGISFYDEIKKYNPDVVKIDIEGAELDLNLSVLKQGTILIIEVHHIVDAKKSALLLKSIYDNYDQKFQTQTKKKTGEPYQTIYVGIRK